MANGRSGLTGPSALARAWAERWCEIDNTSVRDEWNGIRQNADTTATGFSGQPGQPARPLASAAICTDDAVTSVLPRSTPKRSIVATWAHGMRGRNGRSVPNRALAGNNPALAIIPVVLKRFLLILPSLRHAKSKRKFAEIRALSVRGHAGRVATLRAAEESRNETDITSALRRLRKIYRAVTTAAVRRGTSGRSGRAAASLAAVE